MARWQPGCGSSETGPQCALPTTFGLTASPWDCFPLLCSGPAEFGDRLQTVYGPSLRSGYDLGLQRCGSYRGQR